MNTIAAIREYKAFSPTAETLGVVVLAFASASEKSLIMPLLEKHQLSNVKPFQWYPQQPWLDVLTEIQHQPDGSKTLMSIGLTVGEHIPMSPFIRRLDQALMEMPCAFSRFSHHDPVSKVEVTRLGDHHFQISEFTPYPDECGYGIYYGICSRFLKHESCQLNIKSNQAGKRRYPTPDGEPLILDISW